MENKIKYVDYQRNGIQGEPFQYVFFECIEDGKKEDLIAVVTDHLGGCYVVNQSKPEAHYRGDNFEHDMREAIVQRYMKTYNQTDKESRKDLNDGLKKPVY